MANPVYSIQVVGFLSLQISIPGMIKTAMLATACMNISIYMLNYDHFFPGFSVSYFYIAYLYL